MTTITATTGSIPDPLCPRCDYDLRGEVDTWKNECPLASRCPECGLDVAWTSVFRIVVPPAWSIEHVEPPARARKVRLVGYALATGVRTFAPRHLWRGLTLAMPVVPARLILMGVLWLVGSYIFAALLMAATVWFEAWLDQRVIAAIIARYPNSTAFNNQIVPPSIWNDPARWLFPFFNVGGRVGGGGGVPAPPVILCAIMVLVVPATLFLMPFSLRQAKVRARHLLRLTAYWLLWVPILAIVPAWTDSLYRMSFAIEGIIAYSGTPVIYQPGKPPPTPTLFEEVLRFVQRHSNMSVVLILFMLIFWFWRNASKHYLRLPRSAMVAFGITSISMLLTASIGYFVLSGADNIVTQVFLELIGH